MRIIHLSYNVPRPQYTDPEAWLKRIIASAGVMESMTQYAEIIGIYHIFYKGVMSKNNVTYHFTRYSRWQVLLPFQFNMYIRNLQPDVVIVHGLISPWQIVMLRWQAGRRVKIIAQHHAERPLKDIRKYLQRWADRYIKAYLFASLDLGRRWVACTQIKNEKKIKEIMGTSSTFYPMEKREARSVTQVKGDRVFLWVGRLDANKDPLTVVKAFSQFVKINPAAELYMIYQTFELEKELTELVRNNEVSDHIHLIGKVDYQELQYWFNSVDFIISSSHYEGSGVAVCEALSCGCVPILTNIPSFRMMTDNERLGMLYEAGHEELLLEALLKSLTLDLADQKKKVLEYFQKELSFDANARKIMQVINEIE